MTKELKQEFERIIKEESFYNIGMPNTEEETYRLMYAAYALGQSSLKSRVEELEGALKSARDVLVMASLIDKTNTCSKEADACDVVLNKAK